MGHHTQNHHTRVLKRYEEMVKAVQAEIGLSHERHTLRKLRREMEYTRNPTAVQSYIDFTRLSIICAKRGYMCFT